jgi:hypothetical protein
MTGLRDTTCRSHLRRLSGGCRVARGGCRMARRQDTTCRRQLSRLRGGCRVACRRLLVLSHASRIVLLLAGGATAATGVWVGFVATTVATTVSSWT